MVNRTKTQHQTDMKKNDLISVIVPVYNCEKYISEALDSIVNQTYNNLEILVVDDGSEDESPAICDKYATDTRVKVFHRPNCGLSATRQFGIDHSNGEYFVTIDSDDYIASDYVEKLYTAIKKNDADIAVCGVSCFSDRSDKISAVYIPNCTHEKLVLTKELLSSDFYRISEDFLMTDSWNKMHRTQFVRDTNVRYELPHIYIGQDMWFELRLALHCPVYCTCCESLLFHRKHGDSMMTRKSIHWQEGFEILTEKLIEDSKLLGIALRKQLTKVYYGMIGILVLNILFCGASFKETHARFQTLVKRNKCFLIKHSADIEGYKGFKTFKVSKYPIPLFILNSTFWMDAMILMIKVLYKIKSKF